MAASVQVLCPNGRRQNVKITPNTKILQVLEEVCKKQGFLPPEEYDLKHGKNLLDISLIFRYSGLPNHAKLELVKASQSRAESTVGVALQLESGERLQHEFLPATTLWEVLQHWEGNSQCSQAGQLIQAAIEKILTPVCIYMREEIVGQVALQHTNLRALGLTQGKAILRLVHRQVAADVLEDIARKIETEKARQAKLASKHSSTIPTFSSSAIRAVPSSQPEAMDTDDGTETKETSEAPSGGEQSNTNVMAESMETEVPSSSGSNSEKKSDESGNFDIPGVQVFRPGEIQLTPEERQTALRLLPGIFPPDVDNRPVRPRQQRQPQPVFVPQPAPFVDFKFPEETKGKDVYRNELSDVKREEFKPCDRQTTLFSLNEPKFTQPTEDELPDDFFDVTEADIRSMMMELQKKLDEDGNQMLMTSAMRKAQIEAKMEKYKHAVVRVQFPDRMVLQGIFRSRETVHALKKYVKEHLEDKSLPFYLYTTPPREVLKDDTLNLIEAKLVPASVVHFGSEVVKDHYLSTAAIGEVSPYNVADQVARKCMLGGEEEGRGGGESSGQNRGQVKRAATSGASSKSGDARKVPKWFTAGKK